mmetsp:Transcript_14154/g.42144  ORF Transcript_14154/g.42144 Transcript_14154/m.42144 type:complete len:207 (-) Transcript_14154:47-667(-)
MPRRRGRGVQARVRSVAAQRPGAARWLAARYAAKAQEGDSAAEGVAAQLTHSADAAHVGTQQGGHACQGVAAQVAHLAEAADVAAGRVHPAEWPLKPAGQLWHEVCGGGPAVAVLRQRSRLWRPAGSVVEGPPIWQSRHRTGCTPRRVCALATECVARARLLLRHPEGPPPQRLVHPRLACGGCGATRGGRHGGARTRARPGAYGR